MKRPQNVWDDYKFPTDGPMPTGQVKVSGVTMPIRVFILKGVVVPIPWPPEVETKFRAWFRLFALSKGWSTNPDHDKYDVDWRAAYFLGFKDLVKDHLKTRSGNLPGERFTELHRTVNHRKDPNKKEIVIASR